MKDKILVIDGDNLAHRAAHKFSLTNQKGVPTGVLFGFIYILRPLIVNHGPTKVIIAFDGGRSKERKKILPGYKDREKVLGSDYKSFVRQKKILMSLLPSMGMTVVHGEGLEADDIIYRIVRDHPNQYITIVSSDKDFIPLLSNNVKVLNPFKNRLITIQNCEEEYNYPHTQFLDFLILMGDKSDKIPGVTGMGKVRIKEFMDEFDSIEDYLEDDDKGKWVKYPIKEVYKTNKQLISLPRYYRMHGKYEKYVTYAPGWDRNHLYKVCVEYNIRKFLAESFTKPFKEVYESNNI